MRGYVKRRDRPAPGTIPAALDMFRAEVRFYREVAPVLGVRVPHCYQAEDTGDGTYLLLEDLSEWRLGADPVAAAAALSDMHQRWQGEAPRRWPWLRPVGAAATLVGDLFDRTWPGLAARPDLPTRVRDLGQRLVGQIVAVEGTVARAGSLTLVHGDLALRNLRTGPAGEIALLDWEDVSAAPGALDLAWLLVSSVEPAQWGEVRSAYGPVPGLAEALPSVVVQGLLSLADTAEGSPAALSWVSRLKAADAHLNSGTP